MFSTDAVNDRIVKTIEHNDGTSTQYLAIIAPDDSPENPLKSWDMAISFYVPAWDCDHRRDIEHARDILDADTLSLDTDRASARLRDQTIDQNWYEPTNASAWLQLFRACDPSGIAFIVQCDFAGYGRALSISDDDDESSREFAIAYRSAASIREDFGVKRITKRIRERAIESLKGELETLNAYFDGEVYGYQVLRQELDAEGETIESIEIDACWGYYGSDEWKHMYAEALDAAERDAKQCEIDRQEASEAWRALDTPALIAA